ncbi:hypothetical protein OW763_15800 [Clostridium aestuarii]|uniref:Phage protein n=1 Tax=Clostridium aestuarii TaxID=338193 RepID=A0ABT4D3G7_9CLOT|nr:hypothetical protein [Clostridium aestuarii]MCY6485784.1 hypothetical protein [Clostridium aestuarii]
MEKPFMRVMFYPKGNPRKPILADDEIKNTFGQTFKIYDDLIMTGYEDFNLAKPEDVAFLDLLMKADTVEVNGGEYKIVERQIRANKPRGLWIMVQPIESSK